MLLNPVILKGLVAPAGVLAAAGVAGIAFGTPWAVAVLVAGGGAIIAFHLWHIGELVHWAEGAPDEAVPEGHGSWHVVFSALHRRARTRTAYQRDLKQTIERFARAAEAVPDGMVVLDAANRIRWANARALAHLGLDLARDAGRPLVNLVRQPEFIRYLDAEDFSDAVVVESQRAAGVTLSIQVVPFGVDEKLLISRDITRLESVTRMHRDFVANVSHELKTPLTVISGFVETLQDLAPEPRQRDRYLQLMREQARSMERLVDDLLTLTGLEDGQNPPLEAPFALAPLLLELSAQCKALSGGQHEIRLDCGPTAKLIGNRDEVASALGNLVSNAVRYTPAGGTVTLAWRHEDNGDGTFSVADTGIGIAREHWPRLTERFYRVDRSRSRATGGTGLGLAIVKHVLLRHQARLTVKSEPGRGSTFSVRLPAQRVVPAAATGDDATAATDAVTAASAAARLGVQ